MKNVLKGHIAVYVGETSKSRFMIPSSYLNHLLFEGLLNLAEAEFPSATKYDAIGHDDHYRPCPGKYVATLLAASYLYGLATVPFVCTFPVELVIQHKFDMGESEWRFMTYRENYPES
ncbi:hypothetical protein Goklo_017040 [Gossypium klotzschianum]|nr:hypothetical protein [Gossypium klotzschianum]